MDIDPQTVKYGFDAIRSAIESLKAVKDTFGGTKQAELGEQINAAERQVKLAEAQLAQALGFPLCRAHFPPVPMLMNRVEPNRGTAIHRCPECAREDTSLEHFASLDRIDEASARFANIVVQHGNYDPFSV